LACFWHTPSEKGTAFIDRALYLPREWVGDIERREGAGIPQTVRFATKGKLAKEMLRRALEAAVPARWVVADTVYGTARGLRGWLEEQECSYVLAVPATQGVYHTGRQRQVRALAKLVPEEAWARVSAGTGSKGERLYDWACLSLPEPDTQEAERWLLLRRNIDDPAELAYYLAYGPKGTPAEELIRVAGRRWAIEDSFEAAKGEVGLDEYEVRKWDAWHRHITLCLLAHAYLVILRSAAKDAVLLRNSRLIKRGSLLTSDPADGARGETVGGGYG
jgi:SRSO17 transposase